MSYEISKLINSIICADCYDVLKELPDNSDYFLLTDPPYPNKANHFTESVEVALSFLRTFSFRHSMIFWDEMSEPYINSTMVAKHIWHRSNTNRPDNYEIIYEYTSDGIKRASRVLSYPVVYPGLTGCVEATGHPTQKPVSLIVKLLLLSREVSSSCIVVDPFCGSGTTAIACEKLGFRYICIDKESDYVEAARNRLLQFQAQGDLFAGENSALVEECQTNIQQQKAEINI